jgi:signal transduction histidine kinase
VEQPPEAIWLHGDATRLEQVVVNLLTNAAKYTTDKGRITVTLRREGTVAVLRVRDTGEGISPDFVPHVFDLYSQADQSLERSGGSGSG